MTTARITVDLNSNARSNDEEFTWELHIPDIDVIRSGCAGSESAARECATNMADLIWKDYQWRQEYPKTIEIQL